MSKTKTKDNVKKLLIMKKKAKEMNNFKLVAKLDLRLKKCYKMTKGKSLFEFF